MSDTVADHVRKAIQNINDDRQAAAALLEAGMVHIESKEDHAIIGQNLAKYVETLQRSNEQYVKLIAILNKNAGRGEVRELNDDDRFDFFYGEEEPEEDRDVG